MALAAGLDAWGFFGGAMPGPLSGRVLEQLERGVAASWLWGMGVKAAERLPWLGTTEWLALASAFFGVWCVGLLAWLLARAPFRMAWATQEQEEREREGRCLAGLAGGTWLAVSAPFWVASTRAGPATFHLWMLLGTVWLFWRYRETGKARWLAGGMAAWGALSAQTATGWILGPFLFWEAFWESVRWDRHGRWRTWAAWLAGAAAGLALYAVQGWWLCRTGRVGGGLQAALEEVLKAEFGTLAEFRFSPGLLVFGAELAVPWAALYGLSHRSPWHYELGEKGFRLFLGTGLAVLAWTPPFAPCFLIPGGLWEPSVAPQLVLAACFGGVAGEIWIMGDPGTAAIREERGKRIRRAAMGCVAVALVASSLAAVWRNEGLVRIPGDLWTLDATAELARSAEKRRVVFCGPPFEDMLSLASRGRRWMVAGAMASRTPGRSLFLGARMGGGAAGKLFAAGAYDAGVRTWLAEGTNAESALAVGNPGPYRGQAWLAPEGLAWRLEASPEAADPAEAARTQEALWQRAAAQSERRLPPMNPYARYWGVCRMLLGREINDTAVALAGRGDWEEADRLLALAEKISPENPSVKMNRERAGVALGLPEAETAARRAYREDDEWKKQGVWMLGAQWGYLHDPEGWLREGAVWALSGAAEEEGTLRKSALATARDGRFAKWVDYAFIAVGREEADEGTLRRALAANPWSAEPLLELYLGALRAGRVDAAEAYLREAEGRGVREESIPFEWLMADYARLAAAGGEEFPSGRAAAELELESPLHDPGAWLAEDGTVRDPAEVFETLAKHESGDLRPWMALYLLAEGREPESGRIERVFRLRRRTETGLWLALGTLHAERGEWEKAREELELVLTDDTDRTAVWELAMAVARHYENHRLIVSARDRLQKMRPGHFLAQDEIGRERLARGDAVGAVQALGLGILHKRDPALLERLAGALYELDPEANAVAATELVEEAILRDPGRLGFRRTLAAIELGMGETDAALRNAGRVMTRTTPVLADYLLVAEIFRARGDIRRVGLALRRIERLGERPKFVDQTRIFALRDWLDAQVAEERGEEEGAEILEKPENPEVPEVPENPEKPESNAVGTGVEEEVPLEEPG